MRRITFVVHVQRTAPKRYSPVIHNCAQLRSNFLSDQTGKRRGFLSVEISFQTMTNSFVQENPRPAGPEDHFHRACRRVDSSKLKNCLPGAFARNRLRVEISGKYIESASAASTLITGLPSAPFFSDAHDVHAHQWLTIPGCIALRCDD